MDADGRRRAPGLIPGKESTMPKAIEHSTAPAAPIARALSVVVLRFSQLRDGIYLAIAGEAPGRMLYIITRKAANCWCVEAAREAPGLGWRVFLSCHWKSLKAAMARCDEAARAAVAPVADAPPKPHKRNNRYLSAEAAEQMCHRRDNRNVAPAPAPASR